MSIYKKIQSVKAKIGKLTKDQTNPFFKSKYFDINSLIEQIEPLLQEADLLLLQPIKDGCVSSQIVDLDTGDTIESSLCLPSIDDAQKVGSAITYYRRYTLQSLLGLQAQDDDGNKASAKPTTQKTKVDKWLSEDEFEKAKSLEPKQISSLLNKYSGTTYADGKVYAMKKDYKVELLKRIA